MSVRRSVLGVLVGCATALLTLGVGVAGAEAPRLVTSGTFPAEGPTGIAVDQSSGDVFTAGLFGAGGPGGEEEVTGGPVDEFNAAGKELSPPSPLAENSLYYGVAVNPTNGNLYVATLFGEIDVYAPGAGLVHAFPAPKFWDSLFFGGIENVMQIATDSAGNVYVPSVPENKVFEYNENGELQNEIGGSGSHALGGPTGVAVNSSGDVWVADDGHNRVEEFSPAGAFMSAFSSENPRALALDGRGDVLAIVFNSTDSCGVLASPCEHMVEYSESGAQLADVGAGEFGSGYSSFEYAAGRSVAESMVAVNEASGHVYVSDGTKNRVWVFQPPVKPTLSREAAVEVGTSEAKLGALVDPGGAAATYRFEYDTREYREGEGPHGVSVPVPEGSAGEGFSAHTVWASAKGLAPGTTYHYRAIVTNGLGAVVGPDETFTTATAAEVACPNEDTRGGLSAALPDCRAYEVVSPASTASAQPDTGHIEYQDVEAVFNSVNPGGGFAGNYASADGNRFSYIALEVMTGSQTAGLEFIATRGANGWTTQDAVPPQSYNGDRCTLKPETFVLDYSADLSKAIAVDHQTDSDYIECLTETPEVASGEPLEPENLLLSNYGSGGYQLINITPPGVTPTNARLVAASADLSAVLFAEHAALTPEAQDSTAENLYEWREGAVHLLQFVLPSGASVAGSFVGFSPDGSEMFFTAGGSLYVHLYGAGRTVQLDQPRGGSGPGGGGSFAAVSADGSQVFFGDDVAAGLTSDTVPGSGTNLYRYDVATGQLSDLTPVAGADAKFAGSGGEGFKGIGEDGSYVYFESPAVLTGPEANQFGETAQSGAGNLYLDHEGAIKFVWHRGAGVFSANGAFFAFNAEGEIHQYSAAANRFQCASCNPSGEAPTAGGVALASPNTAPNDHGVPYVISDPHSVSDNGQVFFETTEALLPADTDGVSDVYEFDWGSGLHLISSGTSAKGANLLDASLSGDDVFFLTRQQLAPQDNLQEATKIYDARVDGGFPEVAVPPACTTADACRSAPEPQPAIYGAPTSQTFSGAGNLAPQPAAVKSAKKKSKQQQKKKKKKKKGKAKKSTGACRRGGHGRARCAGRTGAKATSHRRGDR